METITLANGITYNILAEEVLTGKASEQGFYKTLMMLQRPKGSKTFYAMRDVNGIVSLN